MTRSVFGIKAESAFKKVVLPELVPPLMKMLYPAATAFFRKAAASAVSVPKPISVSIVMGSGNFRMVTAGPPREIGGSTM